MANGTLVIFEVTREDAGPYLCRLANVGGMVYHNTTLTVRSKLSPTPVIIVMIVLLLCALVNAQQ